MEFSQYEIDRKGFFTRSLIINKNGISILECQAQGFFSNNYVVKDDHGNILIQLQKEFSFFKRKYLIDTFNEQGTITKLVMSHSYEVESTAGQYTVEGNFWGTNFKVFFNGENIGMCVSPVLSHKFQFAVEQGPHENFVLGIVLGVMIIIRQQRKKSG